MLALDINRVRRLLFAMVFDREVAYVIALSSNKQLLNPIFYLMKREVLISKMRLPPPSLRLRFLKKFLVAAQLDA